MNHSKHLILNHNTHELQQTHESQQTHEPQQTHETQQTHEPQILTNELQLKKMIKIIKMLFDDFAYEEFICADFKTEYVSKSIIILK